MDPLTIGLMAGGFGLGAMQGAARQRAEKARNMAQAAQTRYSPWTHMGAGQIQDDGQSPWINALQTGVGAGTLGASIQETQSRNRLNEMEADYIGRRANMLPAYSTGGQNYQPSPWNVDGPRLTSIFDK